MTINLDDISATGKIMIVQPDYQTREMLAEIFKKNNFEVLTAEDGVEALLKMKGEAVDVVLTALTMPRMGGVEFAKKKNNDEELANIPIVFYDNVGSAEEKDDILQSSGAKDFIEKGTVAPGDIIQVVARTIRQGNYYFRIDPYALDAQVFINDHYLNENFKCTNCGADLAFKVTVDKQERMRANVVCPVCGKKYL